MLVLDKFTHKEHRLAVYYPIDRVHVHQGEQYIVGFKSYHVGNVESWDLNHVAKYYWIKTGVIKPYDNLRL